jgi:dTMP kinase
MKQNLFIVLEGIDGSGKSTQIKFLTNHLKQAGIKVYATAEPSNSRIGAIIKDIFSHKMEADHRTIAALYVADRLDHLLNKTDGILKKLEEGYTVICDRYYFSSYAYQGTHMDMDWVIEANSLSAGLLRPDLNIFIDISPELSMQRLRDGRSTTELYETTENLYNVRNKYFEAFEKLKDKEKIVIIDGSQDEKIISGAIWNEVLKINEHQKSLHP